ncbi:hypothetical protein EMIT048CA2_590001 [Pseudomonas chlororaphis]
MVDAKSPVQPLTSIASESFVICPFSAVQCASAFCSDVLAVVTAANAWRLSVGWIAMPV